MKVQPKTPQLLCNAILWTWTIPSMPPRIKVVLKVKVGPTRYSQDIPNEMASERVMLWTFFFFFLLRWKVCQAGFVIKLKIKPLKRTTILPALIVYFMIWFPGLANSSNLFAHKRIQQNNKIECVSFNFLVYVKWLAVKVNRFKGNRELSNTHAKTVPSTFL